MATATNQQRENWEDWTPETVQAFQTAKRKARVNVKSLAAEAKAIRHDSQAGNCELAWHRIQVVRPEARAALLAYAAIRNRSYTAMEARANYSRECERYGRYGWSKICPFARALQKVHKWTTDPTLRDRAKRWLDDAAQQRGEQLAASRKRQ